MGCAIVPEGAAAGGRGAHGALCCRVLLVRHGITAWNLQHRYHSYTDVPLHPLAERSLAPAFSRTDGECIDRILCSPTLRARQTAILFAERHRPAPPISVRSGLRELDFGRFEGRTRYELRSGALSRDFRSWLSGADGEPSPPEGEPWSNAVCRVSAVLEEAASAGGTSLVVSHGYALRAMFLTALGLPPSDARRLRWGNGRIAVLDWADGLWSTPLRAAHGQDGSSSWQMTSSRTSQPRG